VPVDDDLARLDDNLRRLKVEYEAYFNGGLPHPPRETVFRVESVVKRFTADQSEMNFGQRFRFNQLAQRYTVYNELWRKRLRDLEEGRGRREPASGPSSLFRIIATDPVTEGDKLNQLFDVWLEARRQMGEPAPRIDSDVFAGFIRNKTAEIKQRLGCKSVEFQVIVEGGSVRLKAARR